LVSRIKVYTWNLLPDLLPETDLLVNATPIGMMPYIDQSPLSLSLWELLPQNAIAYDLIYTPNPTLFLQQAQAQGLFAIDGLEMLVQQGAAALKIWLGRKEVPVEVMRQVLRQHLGL
jgi:shikimate dehydrogenase